MISTVIPARNQISSHLFLERLVGFNKRHTKGSFVCRYMRCRDSYWLVPTSCVAQKPTASPWQWPMWSHQYRPSLALAAAPLALGSALYASSIFKTLTLPFFEDINPGVGPSKMPSVQWRRVQLQWETPTAILNNHPAHANCKLCCYLYCWGGLVF